MDYIWETAPNIGERRLSVIFEIFPELETTDEVLALVFHTSFRRGAFVDDKAPFENVFPGRSKKSVQQDPDFIFEDLRGFFLTRTGLSCYLDWDIRGYVHQANHIPYGELTGIKRQENKGGDDFIYIRFRSGVETVWSPNAAFAVAFFEDLFALLKREGAIMQDSTGTP